MTESFTDNDQPPGDPAEALRMIEAERAATLRKIYVDDRWWFWPWGFAWLIGFGLLFLRYGPDGRVFVDMPQWVPVVALNVLLIGAGVISGLTGARAYGQLVGESARRGAYYGWAWGIAFTTMSVILVRVTDAIPEDLRTMVWSAVMAGLTGALHMAGGAVWLHRQLFLLGAWISAVNVAGVLAGPGWQSLFMCVAAGGGMIVFGWVSSRWHRRAAAR
ncbi:transporter [Asanoa sp. WMMD1127]|uniref:transporter n=1 Tax=Asanoa sp. WMMD1127 TaxID=3016107 RepID=UPI002417BFEB|nr:transporter [Asanoa sp. WMMD1127]MDG4824233.1 transporter [Asanoa sp. WMMD1127]